MVLVAAVVVFVLGAIGGNLVFKQYFYVPEPSDELHHVETEDGVEIGIYHHLPDDGPGDGEPVVLCHGLSVNHRDVDFDETRSIAKYLSEQGYDCWAPDLRGRGASEVPDESWSFDHYVEQDLPAVIDHVRETTGSDEVHWVGHSMGGMLYYVLAGGEAYGDALASGVTLGSPVQFRRHRGKFLYYLSIFGLFSRPVFGFPKRIWPHPLQTRWAAVFLPVIPHRIALAVLNKRNVVTDTIRRAANHSMAMVSPRVVLNFADWVVHDRWKSEDHTVNYRRRVETVETPTRMISGSADHLCPAPDVAAGYEEIPTDDKDYVEAGPEEGMEEGYGHVDLVFGERAPDEIFPLIAEWLEDHPIEGRESEADTAIGGGS
jgi:pimeloyl-ACP methyl ester carboxylesterase